MKRTKEEKQQLYKPKQWGLYCNDEFVSSYPSHNAAKAALHRKCEDMKKYPYDYDGEHYNIKPLKISLTLEDIYSMVESATKKLLSEGIVKTGIDSGDLIKKFFNPLWAMGFNCDGISKEAILSGKQGKIPNNQVWNLSYNGGTISVTVHLDHAAGKSQRVVPQSLRNFKIQLGLGGWFNDPNNRKLYMEKVAPYWEDNLKKVKFGTDFEEDNEAEEIEQANAEYANASVIPIWGGKNPISILKVVGDDGKEAYNTCKGGNDRRPINDEWFEGVEPDKDGYSSVFTKEYDDGEHMFKACTVNPETGNFENFELFENKKYGKFGKSKKRPLW
jgi:hypothetical protein